MLPLRMSAESGEFQTLGKKRKLRWFGHIARFSGLAKTILQGRVKGNRRIGRQKKRSEDNIKEWTVMDFAGSTRASEDSSRWKGIVVAICGAQRPRKFLG